MAYQAIARRWRPHKFEDLVGQAHVVQTLKNSILGQRVSHAYLFSGARGVGKTSVARIFAKALRCPNAKDAVPCNECSECTAISESRSIDVAEIDCASHNGVEAVRSIRDNVAYSASTGFYKIYIIDEAHMLSLSAFNALLNTLEEPPAHVIFMMATTEFQKIPVTILSRCQRFEFRRLSQTQIVDRLKHILTTEKMSLSEDAMRVIAAHADGSLRDALSLLDQVLSHESNAGELDEAKVVAALGISPTSSVTEFWAAILQKDIPRLLKLLDGAHAAGVDLKHFSERCLEELRLLYLISLSQETGSSLSAEALDTATTHFQSLEKLAATTARPALERMAQILTQTCNQIGHASFPRFVLEMSSVRMAQLGPLAQLEAALSGGPVAAIPVKQPAPVTTQRPAPVNTMKQPVAVSSPPSPPPPAEERRPSAPTMGGGTPNWQGFIDTVMRKRPLLGALLTHGEFQMEPDKKITLLFPEGSFYERQARDVKNRSDIEDQLKAFFGPEVKLQLATGEAEKVRSIEKSRQQEEARIKKDALEHPSVVQMKEALGAEVVDINVEV